MTCIGIDERTDLVSVTLPTMVSILVFQFESLVLRFDRIDEKSECFGIVTVREKPEYFPRQLVWLIFRVFVMLVLMLSGQSLEKKIFYLV